MMEIPGIHIEQKMSGIEELPEESSDKQSSNEETDDDETEYSNEGEEGEEEEEGEEGEEESVEEGEIDPEMTSEEKKAMCEAVKSGDVDALEECLDKPHSDINMIWFKENLLMAAIRHGQEEMAEFLLDNGVDYTYSTAVMELRGTPRGIRIDRYDLTCRQMAYDRSLLNIVQIIDLLEGNVFPFVHLPDRTPRHRRPKPTFSEGENDSDESDNDFCNTASCSDSKGSVQSSRRSEEKTQKMTEVDTEAVGVHQEQTETEGLSKQVENGYHHIREHDSNKHVNKKQQNWNKNDTLGNEIQESDKSRHKVDMANVDLLYSRLDGNIMKSHPHLLEGGLYSQVSKNTDKLILNKQPEGNEKCAPKTFGQTVTKDTASNDLPVSKSPVSAKPTNRIYLSKSALTLFKVNSCKRLLSDLQANIQNKPLEWKKVTTTGSYTTESRHWHTDKMKKQKPSEEVTDIASSAAHSIKHSVHQIPRSSSQPNYQSKRSASPLASCEDDSIKQLSLNKESSTKTAEDTSSCTYDHHRPARTIKRKINPRFMNSYEVLNFIPDIRRQASSASGSS